VVGTALLAVVTIVTLAFPFAARVYAARAVEAPGAEPNQTPPGGSSDPNAEGDPDAALAFDDSLPRDMGIRSLPLLSDWAVEQWETGDLDAAVHAAGERVFGDSWNTLWLIPSPEGEWRDWLREANYSPGAVSQGLPELSGAVAALAFEQEADLLDLAGLLALKAASRPDESRDWSGDYSYIRSAAYALALVESAAHHFASCDAYLSAGHMFGLTAPVDRDYVTDFYDTAIDQCPDDQTPVIEKARLSLLISTSHDWSGKHLDSWRTLASAGDWPAVEADLAELVSATPGTAAAHALAGDGFTLLARRSPVGPFSARHFQEQELRPLEWCIGWPGA
jgi:hypothetical protein